MPENDKNKNIMLAFATLVLGLVIGGAVGYAMSNSQKDTENAAMTATSAPDTSMSKTGGDGTTVGGAKMVRTLDIVDNAVNAKNVTTVVSLVKLAGLVETLKGEGPFTVFAPDNDAFGKLPKETVDAVQKPENKALLTTILTYHVVAGTYTTADLRAMAGKGETLTTVQGGVLTPVVADGQVKIKDVKGDVVDIATPDVISSNGVTHVISSVLMPQ